MLMSVCSHTAFHNLGMNIFFLQVPHNLTVLCWYLCVPTQCFTISVWLYFSCRFLTFCHLTVLCWCLCVPTQRFIISVWIYFSCRFFTFCHLTVCWCLCVPTQCFIISVWIYCSGRFLTFCHLTVLYWYLCVSTQCLISIFLLQVPHILPPDCIMLVSMCFHTVLHKHISPAGFSHSATWLYYVGVYVFPHSAS
jgi:hypothetical protein